MIRSSHAGMAEGGEALELLRLNDDAGGGIARASSQNLVEECASKAGIITPLCLCQVREDDDEQSGTLLD
jgi:hypothetical protein